MAQDFAKAFYKGKKWRQVRKAYIRAVGGFCERCLAMGDYTMAEDVHHKILLTAENITDPNISLNHEHLIALCKSCHTLEHKRSEVTREDVRFDESGNLIER